MRERETGRRIYCLEKKDRKEIKREKARSKEIMNVTGRICRHIKELNILVKKLRPT